jgi:YgiT-type zinc finger domain-containing protein
MKYLCCVAAKLPRQTCDIIYSYKGGATTIQAVTGNLCPAHMSVCGA